MKKPRIKHRIEYWITYLTGAFARMIPYRLALALGSFLGWLAFDLLRIRRKVTLTNLKNSLGAERDGLAAIGRRAYRNFGKSMVEYTLFPSLDKNKIEQMVEFEGAEHFDDALKRGKGAVVVAGHFGSWELMGAATSQKGYPVDFLVGEQHNILVDNLMNEYRRCVGIGIIKIGAAAKGVISALRNNRFVAMLSDQDAGSDGTVVELFGRPASTPKGPAAFALKMDAPIVMAFIIREGERKQKIVIEKAIFGEKTSDKEEDIRRLTQAYTRILEEYVRRYPDHWFWPHRRWKSTTREY
ncbi:MAG: lysophospholipid acyltransferase family protein [Candidatus Zixiibacteriota bacterium]|nr:MAG: lysophospholipid acyltransferase family protein [candidate division Zixibacteria bacterium]